MSTLHTRARDAALAIGTFAVGGLALAACGGGGSPTSSPPPPSSATPTPMPSPPDFSSIDAAADAFSVANMAVLIGDETGVLHTYEKGDFTVDDPIRIASASKLLSGLTLWLLIEEGTLAREDRPQDYLDYWTDLEPAGRSAVTLDMLGGFTSGFNARPAEPGCIGRASVSAANCVREIYDGGVDTLPGTAFAYGPEHLQTAGVMAAEAVGVDFPTLVRERLLDPIGVSSATGFADPGDNSRYAGAMTATAADYGLILTALLAGDMVSDLDGFLENRTGATSIAFQPATLTDNLLDWRYGFGFWKECDETSYAARCDDNVTLSSPGASGFTPWVDFETGYWGVIAFDGGVPQGQKASVESVRLEQELQPLIETALGR